MRQGFLDRVKCGFRKECGTRNMVSAVSVLLEISIEHNNTLCCYCTYAS